MLQGTCAASVDGDGPRSQPLGKTKFILHGAKGGLTYIFHTLPPPAVQSVKKKDQVSSFWKAQSIEGSKTPSKCSQM